MGFFCRCRLLPRPRRRHSRVGGNPKCGRFGAMFNNIPPKIKPLPGFNINPKVNILDSRLRGNDGRGAEFGGGGGKGIFLPFFVFGGIFRV